MTSTTGQEPLSFLDLPAELRLQVYSIYFKGEKVSTEDPWPPGQSVFRLCRQIREEAMEVQYEEAMFELAITPFAGGIFMLNKSASLEYFANTIKKMRSIAVIVHAFHEPISDRTQSEASRSWPGAVCLVGNASRTKTCTTSVTISAK